MNALQQALTIPAAGVTLEAEIVIPETAAGLVLFAHGSPQPASTSAFSGPAQAQRPRWSRRPLGPPQSRLSCPGAVGQTWLASSSAWCASPHS
jgi:hypothetical protein